MGPGYRRVRKWPGGELRVVLRRPDVVRRFEVDGKNYAEFGMVEKDWMEEAGPSYGDGFALLKPTSLSAQGLWLDIEVRDGVPACVAIRSEPGQPPITTGRLREIKVDTILKERLPRMVVRLWRTPDGEVIGEDMLSTEELIADVESLTADAAASVQAALASRQGRRPITDARLQQIADAYRRAISSGLPTTRTVAETCFVTEGSARRLISRARDRGFLEPPPGPRQKGEMK